MRKPSHEDEGPLVSADAKLEGFMSGFLAKHPRLLLYVGLGIGVLIIAALFVAKVTGHSQ